ncbi:FGFR1 oncogene partner isoform X7 [Tachysurus fulvidraco]|uniref:FGFR1 oncogene partner isoform X7 n=1 Tax=Tachysurus fulvidraco TaxID=1234273 RepID=UPI001FEDF529|nr:FGFR1 oncogene partner isoform X7 [Tachysurus fulvidraco]
MSATEEDTELRDLLIQNLENNGVLNKIKAELRAAVFLALEEQDKVENKTPLVNENLKKFLSTKDGRLVTSLITDFLQVFNLDFTLAVFQPEINTVSGLDSRESLSREFGFSESEGNKSTPLLLELIKRGRNKEKFSIYSEADRDRTRIPKELSLRQIAEAQKKYDCKCKDRSDGLSKDEVVAVFIELFPSFSRGMLERFVADELGAKDTSVDFQEFLGLIKQLYCQCRSLVASDGSAGVHSVSKVTEEKITSSPTSKAGEPPSHSESLIFQKSRAFVASEGFITSRNEPSALRRPLDLGLEDDDEEGDSFFDDPLPKPQKTYGCSLPSTDKPYSGQRLSEKSFSQKDLSAIGSDTEGDGEDMFSDAENKPSTNSEPRRSGSAKPVGLTPSPLSDTPLLKRAEHNQKDTVSSKDGLQGLKTLNKKAGSPLPDEELDYDDDFNSHNSKTELSISEEIEEASVEGPDLSDRLEEITQDVSVSQTSQAADYMEDVA